MAGFDHGSVSPPSAEDNRGADRRARIGLVLFTVYFLFYAGFMGLSAFAPATMRSTPVGGMTLAVTYGFGLILAALGLSLLYSWLCRPSAAANESADGAAAGAATKERP